jgi:CRP/FNR family transcriptional regulator, cyclic AMP receptor protein
LTALGRPPWGSRPPPWASGRREEAASVDQAAAAGDSTSPTDRIWCLAEVDIFRDLSAAEVAAIAAAAPMKTYAAGETLYSPHSPVEVLFILKSGRVRIFRVAADRREVTTAILTPGTIFGEMVLIGQHMYDNFAEALDEATVCVMNRADVQRFLLSDPRIAARITETLGSRLAEMERRLADTMSKTVPQRLAAALATLAAKRHERPWPRPFSRATQVTLTHDQLAALVGTSRETATKILDEYAGRGLIRLARGRIVVLDKAELRRAAEDG